MFDIGEQNISVHLQWNLVLLANFFTDYFSCSFGFILVGQRASNLLSCHRLTPRVQSVTRSTCSLCIRPYSFIQPNLLCAKIYRISLSDRSCPIVTNISCVVIRKTRYRTIHLYLIKQHIMITFC